ncbi:MAG TPA: SIMPL domain-containing protein [Rhodopila sp.]
MRQDAAASGASATRSAPRAGIGSAATSRAVLKRAAIGWTATKRAAISRAVLKPAAVGWTATKRTATKRTAVGWTATKRAAIRRAATIAAAIAAVLIASGAALAQGGPNTLLHLSAISAVQAAPDQLVADLVAQSTSASAAEAQRRVNALIAEGMQMAKGTSGVEARAIGYSVNPTDEKRATWTTQQTLELRGADGPALLDLAGRLQAKGLAMAALEWQLTPELRRKAHDEATAAALKELQARAAAAADSFGLHVDHWQEVRLDGPMLRPRLAMPMQAMAAARAAPPPQATAAPEDVTAEVSADVVLRP